MTQANPETAPSSRTAAMAVRVALFGLASAGAGILGIHAGVLAPLSGFTMFAAGTLVFGLAAVLLGAVALVLTRGGRDHAGRRKARIAAACGASLLALPLLAGWGGRGLPPINDITTDLADPPAFAPAERVADYRGRDMAYPPEFAAQVRAAYPDLAPLDSPLAPERAFEQALATAEALGWEVHFRDPQAGVFDARDTTRIFRFVDDITLRVRPTPGGSRIDLRSKSRDGRGDLGANATRIRRFARLFIASQAD